MDKKALWLKLKGYHFNNLVPASLWQQITAAFGGPDAFSKAFAAKVARKHGWSNAFALKAVSEYKKFVYLGVVSKFHVTPSKIIDVVWHEHLLFTSAYREFCNTVIGYQFDHHPELLPMADETGRYNAQYRDTLEFYKTEFGFDPPSDIWGETKFEKEKLKPNTYESRQKTGSSMDSSASYISNEPLCAYFDGSDDAATAGGDFGGGGAGGDWSDGNDAGSNNGTESGDDSGSDGDGDGGGDGGGCSGGCGGGD
jgi:hypothetical protein